MKSPADREPPQNITSEQNVIGSILLDSATADGVFERIGPEDFWRDSHQIIMRVIRDFWLDKRPISISTIFVELQRKELDERIGGWEAISEICDRTPHAADSVYHAEIVLQHSIRRRVISTAHEIASKGYMLDFEADDYLAFAQKLMNGVEGSFKPLPIMTLADAVDEELEAMEQRKKGEITGIACGIPDLDDLICGFQPGNMIIVAAWTGKGKTSFALNVAERAALDMGEHVLFISREMTYRELAARALASQARVNHKKIRTGFDLTFQDAQRLANASDRIRAAERFYIDDQSCRTPSQIAVLARKIKAKHGLSIIFVDYLQLLNDDSGSRGNRQEHVASISRDLKNLAGELRVPVIALCQFNRDYVRRPDKRPVLSDIRESGAIENDANVVIALHQPEETSLMYEGIVLKNRGGEKGIAKMTFLAHIMRFEPHCPA